MTVMATSAAALTTKLTPVSYTHLLPSGRWKSNKEDTVDWNDKKYCEIWRHEWEVIQNRYLEANDLSLIHI